MKKFLTILNIILLITLVTLTLYIFDVIDIPWLGIKETVEKPLPVNGEEESEEPEEKVARQKSYEELINKGDLYAEKGFYNLAIDSYTQANQKDPDKIEPLLKIGEIHLLTENYELAKNLSLQTLKLNPHSTDAKLILGKSYIGLENFGEAKNIFDSISSDDQDVLYYQGIMALYFGEYERGRTLLDSSVANGTNENYLEKANSFISALNEFNRYQAGLNDHLKVLLARSFVQSFHPQMAKELLWTVLRERRDYRDAWIILGYSYLKLRQYQDAIDALEEAKRQDPEKPETIFFLGLAYAGNDELEKAIEELELALSMGYEPKIHVEQKLAELYFQLEEYEEASEKYEDVISLNATDIDYFIRPIWVYIDKLNKPKKAVALAEKALLNHPDDAMAYNLLGWAYVANRDYINGKNYLEKSLSMNESFDAPYLNLGWMYEQQGNVNKAKEFYKKAFEIGNGSPVANLAAQRYNSLLDKEFDRSIMVNIL